MSEYLTAVQERKLGQIKFPGIGLGHHRQRNDPY